MAYTSKINIENYKKGFPCQLRKLIKEKKCTQKELGETIGVTYQAIGAYMRGESMPVLSVAQAIADYFNVSLDYLSKRSDVPSRNETTQGIHSKTGLSEKAIQNLCSLSPIERRFVNDLLSATDDLAFLALTYNSLKEHKRNTNTLDKTIEKDEWKNIMNDLDYYRYTLAHRFALFAEKDLKTEEEV